MAATGLNFNVKSGTSYTVPANKKFVGAAAAFGTASTNVPLSVGGVQIAVVQQSVNALVRPLVFNAGDVISTSDATGFGLIGQLYDA